MKGLLDMTDRERLAEIEEIISAVDHRCAACDGPVTPTLQEMTQKEISRIYILARERSTFMMGSIRRMNRKCCVCDENADCSDGINYYCTGCYKAMKKCTKELVEEKIRQEAEAEANADLEKDDDDI